MTRILLVTAGMGTPSSSRLLGDRLASATSDALARLGHPAEVDVLELRDVAADLAHAYVTHLPSPALQDAFARVGRAHGVIAVSPVLNAGVSGLFKLFFDLLDEGTMQGRPVLLAATGGTARHSLALDQAMLPLFFYLKAVVAPTAVFAATEDWGSKESGLVARVQRAGEEFASLVAERPGTEVGGFLDDVPDFESLLGA